MKIIKILLTVVLVLLVSGCGSKKPFVEKQAIDHAALMYVYVADRISDDDQMQNSEFQLRINGQNVEGRVIGGEYKVFDMKPATILLSAVRTNVEEMHLKVKLEADKIYYIEIKESDFGDDFTFKEMSASEARKDLANSVLADSFEIDATKYVPDFAGSTIMKDREMAIPAMSEAEIDALIDKKLNARKATPSKVAPVKTQQKVVPVVTSPKPGISRATQMDEIERAYSMKEKGMLTQDEFNKIKAEILAK
jgi:hypothetical protein